eukprot:571276-Amphidinium_carterae.1
MQHRTLVIQRGADTRSGELEKRRMSLAEELTDSVGSKMIQNIGSSSVGECCGTPNGATLHQPVTFS